MPARSLEEIQQDEFLAQAELLATLCAHPGWAAWRTLLRDFRASALEQLAQADAQDFRYWQGAAAALAQIMERPERIVAAAAQVQQAEEAVKGIVRTDLRAVMGLGVDSEGDV